MKTICYIDASNLMKNGYKVDHQKLFAYLKRRFNADIFYFGAVFVGGYFDKHNFTKSDYLDFEVLKRFVEGCCHYEEKINKQINFIEKLNSFGFNTKIKPLKIMLNGKRKADCDVNIVIDGLKNLNNYDKFVLFSGDGDFLPFLRYLKEQQKDIEVYSFKDSTAKEIKSFLGGKWNNLNTKQYRDTLEFK